MTQQHDIGDTALVSDATPTNEDLAWPGLRPVAAALASAAALSACGGGGGGDSPVTTTTGGADPAGKPGTTQDTGDMLSAASYSASVAPTLQDAHRFLVQATFGPKPGEAQALMQAGALEAWLDTQFNMPRSPGMYALTKQKFTDTSIIGPQYPANADDPGTLTTEHVSSSWWHKALSSPDQLRGRVAFALSEILVISMQSASLADLPYTCASFYDLLLDNAFGNYKELVTKVSMHPAMGIYLSHMSNRLPDGNGRIPDQNFAREIMQLFTIGLSKLNMDGSLVLDAKGRSIDTYKPYDVEVLSHVFTGWGWAHKFEDWFPRLSRVESQIGSMAASPLMHSTSGYVPRLEVTNKGLPNESERIVRFSGSPLTGAITFLGSPLTISADGASAPETDRQAALDILFNHPNVAPFIAKQMIQRLVTSNPSKAYVGRVAKAFKDSGLSLKALVKAILLDQEARDTTVVRNDPGYGKLKEQILRVTQYMRAFNVRSGWSSAWQCGRIDSLSNRWVEGSLGQSPMMSPSVFNYFRPGYVAPNTEMGRRGKVTPEMQLHSETEAAAYVRFMQRVVYDGFGGWGPNDMKGWCPWSECHRIYPEYIAELAALTKAGDTAEVRMTNFIKLVNDKLMGGQMSAGLQQHLRDIGTMLDVGTWATPGFGEGPHQLMSTMLMVVAISPEYVVQR